MTFHKPFHLLQQYFLVTKSGLFDNSYYTNTETNEQFFSKSKNIINFLMNDKGRTIDPHPLFDCNWYLQHNQEYGSIDMNPLIHYLTRNQDNIGDPNPYFDSRWYLEQNKDVAQANQNPLVHYLKHGANEGRDPSLRFSTTWYLNVNKDVKHSKMNPLAHFLRYGRLEGRSPTPQTLFINSYNNIEILKDGSIYFLSNDPQLHISCLQNICKNELCLTFLVKIRSLTERNIDPKLYLDYGAGFSEESSFNLLQIDNNYWMGVLPMPFLIDAIRLDPSSSRGQAEITDLNLKAFNTDEAFDAIFGKTGPIDEIINLAKLTARLSQRRRGQSKSQHLAFRSHASAIFIESLAKYLNTTPHSKQIEYEDWVSKYDSITEKDIEIMHEKLSEFSVKPLFSIILPVYNTDATLLKDVINSILSQTYPFFELCIADDASPNENVRKIIEAEAEQDERIKYIFRTENGHISQCSNSALSLATGDFVVLVDHDDLIPKHALWVIAHYINNYPDKKIFFSDEDKIDEDGKRQDPYFKGSFDQYLLYGHNLVSHLGVYELNLVKSIGGFRKGFEGSQDYDLILRCFEHCGADKIMHIPHVLYHWRMVPGSTAISANQKNYAIIAAENALNEHFRRTNLPFVSTNGRAAGNTSIGVNKNDKLKEPLISIIIPTRDGGEYLRKCIDSIDIQTNNVELIIIDNGSTDLSTLRYIEQLNFSRKAITLRYPHEFNFSKINNFGAENAKGEILCFLNDDTEVLSSNWLSRARTLLNIHSVGIVGARLLYPDATVQHFGIYIGLGPHKVAGTPHVGLDATDPGYFSKAFLTQQFSAVTAACMFIRKQDFLKVGGFEPQLRVAYNDVDLCLKIRCCGLQVVCDADIELIHKESKTRGADTTPERRARLDQEAQWMREKWKDILDTDPFFNSNFDNERNGFSLSFPPRISLPWK